MLEINHIALVACLHKLKPCYQHKVGVFIHHSAVWPLTRLIYSLLFMQQKCFAEHACNISEVLCFGY